MSRKIVYTIVLAIAAVILLPYLLPGSVFGYELKDKRDPFVPLMGQEKKSHPSSLEEIVAVEDLLLEGIAISPSGKNVAILNGRMVKEKDRFGSIQIKKISKKTVELSFDGKDYNLSLRKEERIKIGE